MEPKSEIYIVKWPKETANLIDKMKEKPCPLSIYFEKNPANINLLTTPENPVNVDMRMHLIPEKTIPVCVKICEPICAKSDYKINLKIFDRSVGSISIKGVTRISKCDNVKPQITCINFDNTKEGTVVTDSMDYEGFTFKPLGNEFRIRDLGDPRGINKLVFPREGICIIYPYNTNETKIQVNNYARKELTFSVFSNEVLIHEFTEVVNNEVKEVFIQKNNINQIHITGGDYEASVIEICYLTP